MVTKTLTPTLVSDDEVIVETIPMSYDEYQDWYDRGSGRRGEWVDGEVIPFMSTSTRHAELVAFLIHLIRSYFETRPIGRVFPQDVELRTRQGSAREPDLQVVLREHADRIEEMRVRGAADLVVEIISRDSVTRDRQVKFDEYEAAGVPEYWIIEPRAGREAIDLFVLGDNGQYDAVEPTVDGRLASTVLPGLWLEAAWLTAEEFPPAGRLGTQMAEAAEGR